MPNHEPTMKTKRIAILLALACIAYAMSSCTTQTTTAPDGTVTVTKTADPEAVKIGGAVALSAVDGYNKSRAAKTPTTVLTDK